MKTLVVGNYPEKLKIDQKVFNLVWGMNRMNKWVGLSRVVIVVTCNLPFTPWLPEATGNGSLDASYLCTTQAESFDNAEFADAGMLLNLETLQTCQFKSVEPSFGVWYFDNYV